MTPHLMPLRLKSEVLNRFGTESNSFLFLSMERKRMNHFQTYNYIYSFFPSHHARKLINTKSKDCMNLEFFLKFSLILNEQIHFTFKITPKQRNSNYKKKWKHLIKNKHTFMLLASN